MAVDTGKLLKTCVAKVPGPQGDKANEPYMVGLINECDALAMYESSGAVMWAWSQDGLNAWYWHADIDEDTMASARPYTFEQSDGSTLKIESEADNVSDFMAGKTQILFFNGQKFHMTQKSLGDDGIVYYIMGGKMERGLHVAVSPDGDCMIVAAANAKGIPTEAFLDLDFGRAPGKVKITSQNLGGMFRKFAPGALGI